MIESQIKSLKRAWEHCEKCKIGKMAYRHVFGRGSIPCDILFIGEGPGKTEDILGEPFVGQAGELLEAAIGKAFKKSKLEFMPRIYFTNLVACRPTNSLAGGNRPPTEREIKNCFERLAETVRITKPYKIVLLGNTVKQYRNDVQGLMGLAKLFEIYHPAYILRQGGEKSKVFRHYVYAIREIMK